MKKVTYILVLMLSSLFMSLHLIAQVTTKLEWAKQIGGAHDVTEVDMSVDASGNVYCTGYFEGTVDFDPNLEIYNLTSFGKLDIFILKLDPAGNFLWVKQFGGEGYDIVSSITLDAKGNIYATGRFQGTAADFDPSDEIFNFKSYGDIFVLKLDSSGNFIWAKNFGGYSDGQKGKDISVDVSGNVYTIGSFKGTGDFDPGPGIYNLESYSWRYQDIFISKLDSSGNFLWAKQLGGENDDFGNSIFADSFGNVYSTGYTTVWEGFLVPVSHDNAFISKLDASGNFLWTKEYGGGGQKNLWVHGNSITVDASGNIYTLGDFNKTVDFDSGAGTYNLTTGVSQDIFILKLDSSGNFAWVKQLGATHLDEEGYSISLDAFGNVYSTGYFYETVDFDPNVGTYNLSSNGVVDIFILKLDPAGNFVWANKFGGEVSDIGRSITIDAFNNVYTLGKFSRAVDFDPGAGIYMLETVGRLDDNMFIHKMSQNISTEIDEKTAKNNFILYPNPTTGIININFSNISNFEITIYNNLGQKIKTVVNENQFDLTSFEKGIYFITLKTDKTYLTDKIIKVD